MTDEPDAGPVPSSLGGAAPAAGEPVSLSPSLRARAGAALGPAYEIKFLLSEDRAREVEARLVRDLLPDPHTDPALGAYAVTSLVCDTPAFGVFFRDAAMRNRKHRVRRYGASGVVYLERKRSRQGKVRKRRVQAAAADLDALAAGRAGSLEQEWFAREVREAGLRPVCLVRYLRRALLGAGAEGAMRVTFDRSIRGAPADGWSMEPGAPERPLLDGWVVCEFKFHRAMPGPLKAAVAALKLEPTGVSKYRACARALAGDLGLDLARAPAPPAPGGLRA